MEDQEQLIIDLYVNQLCGQHECARKARTNVRKVKEILQKNNIPIRDKNEARLAAKKKRVRK